jgi:hypothetical protein
MDRVVQQADKEKKEIREGNVPICHEMKMNKKPCI